MLFKASVLFLQGVECAVDIAWVKEKKPASLLMLVGCLYIFDCIINCCEFDLSRFQTPTVK